jgi:PAS domain S-box-containing protein
MMIDASTTPITVLDDTLTIVAVNRTWRNLAEVQALTTPDHGLGAHYPAIGLLDAAAIGELTSGIAEVAAGQARDFSYECSCAGTGSERWLFIRALPFAGAGAGSLLIAHEDVSARVRDHETIHRRGEEFRALVEHNPDLIARFDRDLRRVYENPAMITAFGQLGFDPPAERSEIPGPLGELAAQLYRDLEAVFATARERTVEYAIASPEHQFTFQVRLIPEHGPDGAIESVLMVGRDITARVAAETSLREREERLHTQYQAIPLPTFTWRWDGDDFRLLDYNRAANVFTGGNLATLLGGTTREIHHDLPEVQEHLRHCRTTRSSVYHRLSYYSRTAGAHKEVNLTSVFVAPDLVIMHAEDVTERERAESALRASEEGYRQLLEQAADCILIIEGVGRFVMVNARACILTGYSREELLHLAIADLVPPEEAADLPRRAAAVRAQGVVTNERLLRRKTAP